MRRLSPESLEMSHQLPIDVHVGELVDASLIELIRDTTDKGAGGQIAGEADGHLTTYSMHQWFFNITRGEE